MMVNFETGEQFAENVLNLLEVLRLLLFLFFYVCG